MIFRVLIADFIGFVVWGYKKHIKLKGTYVIFK